MSKISVFKFNINDTSEMSIETTKKIIMEYLSLRGFFFNNEKMCYTTGEPNKMDEAKNIALSIGASVAATAVTGGRVTTINTVQRGFEYNILNNTLIIKAYLINNKLNSKSFIHSTFNNSPAGASYYSDLQVNLFKNLATNNVLLTSTEVETINDGSEKKGFKIVAIIFLIMIAIIALTFYILFK